MKMLSAPQSNVHTRERVRKPANLINPVLSFLAGHTMLLATSLRRYFWSVCLCFNCYVIAF